MLRGGFAAGYLEGSIRGAREETDRVGTAEYSAELSIEEDGTDYRVI